VAAPPEGHLTETTAAGSVRLANRTVENPDDDAFRAA
jgi:hypothetical protein